MATGDKPTRYDERQMALILKLAATMRVDDASEPQGRTIEEIEEIAREAGIPPAAVRQAALALQEETPGLLARIMGGPTTFRYERVVGGEIDLGHASDLLDSVQWGLGRHGDVQQRGEGVEWTHTIEEGPTTHVQIAKRDGATRIRAVGRYDDPATWTLIGAGVATIISSTLLWSSLDPSLLGGSGIIAGTGGAWWMASRAFWRGVARRTERRFERMMSDLFDRTRELIARSGTPEALPGSDAVSAPIPDP